MEKLAKFPFGGWVEDFSVGFLKTIGVLEILAAVGLILPAVVDIAPVLVPVTAVCWVICLAYVFRVLLAGPHKQML